MSIGDTAGDNDSMNGSCVRSDWEADNSRHQDYCSDQPLDIASVMEAVERAACGSCWRVAFGMTAAAACDDESLDGQEVADLPRRCKSALDCSSLMRIRRDGECCWLEALLRCHDRRLTPGK